MGSDDGGKNSIHMYYIPKLYFDHSISIVQNTKKHTKYIANLYPINF